MGDSDYLKKACILCLALVGAESAEQVMCCPNALMSGLQKLDGSDARNFDQL